MMTTGKVLTEAGLIFMFRWEVSEWSSCHTQCNGVKTRTVECVSDEDGAKILV